MHPATAWLAQGQQALTPTATPDPQGLSLGAMLVLVLLGLVVAFQIYPALMLLLTLFRRLLRPAAQRRRPRHRIRR
jgi:hypothetical protein